MWRFWRRAADEREGGGRLAMGILIAAFFATPVIGFGVPETIRIPKVQEREKGDPPDSAVFSHWEHSEYQCSSCHPSVFPRRKVGFTHADMDEGRFCGSCHDGTTAFKPKGTRGIDCETCHVPTGEQEDLDEDLW